MIMTNSSLILMKFLKQVETDKTDIEIDTYMSRPPVYTTGENKLASLAHDLGKNI